MMPCQWRTPFELRSPPTAAVHWSEDTAWWCPPRMSTVMTRIPTASRKMQRYKGLFSEANKTFRATYLMAPATHASGTKHQSRQSRRHCPDKDGAEQSHFCQLVQSLPVSALGHEPSGQGENGHDYLCNVFIKNTNIYDRKQTPGSLQGGLGWNLAFQRHFDLLLQLTQVRTLYHVVVCRNRLQIPLKGRVGRT